MIKKLILGATLALGLATGAMAATCAESINQINGISAVERQKMVVACETTKLNESLPPFSEKVEQPKKSVTDTVADSLNQETLTQISTIAKTAGQTVREVAKELNVAVNDFIQTPVGMLTAGLAVWYVAGDTIEGVLKGVWEISGGVLVLVLSTYFYKKFLKYALLEGHQTKQVKGWFGSEKEVKVPVYRTWHQISFGDGDELIPILGVVWIVSVITSLVFIF